MSTPGNVRPTHRGGKPHRSCTRDPQLDVAWDRRSDREECANYEACRNNAAREKPQDGVHVSVWRLSAKRSAQVLDLVVFLASLLVGRDPACLQDAMDLLGYDTRRSDVREAIMGRARLG